MVLAEVKIWNELVGAVAWNTERGIAVFEYEPKFKRLEWDISPLKMPISDNRNRFFFPELRANRKSCTTVFTTRTQKRGHYHSGLRHEELKRAYVSFVTLKNTRQYISLVTLWFILVQRFLPQGHEREGITTAV